MPSSRFISAISLLLCTLLASDLHTAYAQSEASSNEVEEKQPAVETQHPAIPVTVATVESRDVSARQTFTGRIESIESVDIQAKVQGYLETKHFEEGGLIDRGDLLFQLEDDTYTNVVSTAEASLNVANAQKKLAEQTFERQKTLTARKIQSQAQLDEAQANLDVNLAQVSVAQAQLETAQLNLGYTKIRAPFTGRVGRAKVSPGALISPQSGPLVTIVQTDPMYLAFPITQSTLLEVQRTNQSGEDVQIKINLADGSEYTHKGTFTFADIRASQSTDSVTIRATVSNPDGFLLDGQLVNVVVDSNNENLELTIPQQALLLDQQGAFVLIAKEDDTVGQARIEVGTQRDGYAVVKSGLKEGDRVLIDGIQKVRPGAKINPTVSG